MKVPPSVHDLLRALLVGIQDALSDNLVGVYLRGSLAYGDFDEATSDVDVLAVTGAPVDEPAFQRLVRLHEGLAELPNPFARRLEIAYVDQEAVRVFRPSLCHPTLGQGEGERLMWQEHRSNWILERWTVREHGRILWGPDPRTLIDPIAPQTLRQAVAERLGDWVTWAEDEGDPDWFLPLKHKAYVVETMCRILYALETGGLASKPQAVQWALQHLPRHWRALVQRAQAWRTDERVDLSPNGEVRRFVLWVGRFQQGGAGQGLTARLPGLSVKKTENCKE
ncbi:hypothetical protein RY27_08790 [Litorilinea aerophila]|nr:hypothetical protein RY27_08790 [Litorilinea aerophila]